jgi:hypothetical protein
MKLEERAEAEKQLFINKLDKMSKDRKQVELMLKKNGMGDWAVGGKKSIQQYDPEMEEKWRQERAAAGFTDFTDYSAATADAGPLDYGQLQDAMGAEQVDGGELGDYVQGDAEFAGED